MFSGRFDCSYMSSRGNIAAARNPSYFRIEDASLSSFALALEREASWTASLRVSNLWNDFVPLSGRAAEAGLIRTITAARPRTLSLNVEWRFR